MTARNLLVGAGLLVLGALSLSAGWSGWLAPVVLCLAALVPAGAVVGAVRLGVSRFVAVFIVTVLCVLGAYLASAPSGASFVQTVTDAIPRLLTAPFPAPPAAELIAPGALAAGLAGVLVGARLSAARPGRLAPVFAAVALYTCGALLTAGRGDPYGLLAVAIVVLSLAGWVPGGRQTSAGRAGSSSIAPAALLAASVIVLVNVLAVRGAGFEPRTMVTPPVTEIVAPSPLPQLAAWARDADRELLVVSGDEYPLRLVTLPDYDGVSWHADTRFRPLGASEQGSLPPGDRSGEVRSRIRIVDLDGPWLPTPGRPLELSLTGAQLDPETGSLAAPGRTLTGLGYAVRGEVDAPTRAELAAAGTGDPTAQPALRRYLEVPRLPYEFSAYASAVTEGLGTPLEQALAIEAAVRGDRSRTVKAPSGSSYSRLSTFLFGPDGTFGAQTGTSEQFASAFAVLARSSGLPTRIVVGFAPGTASADTRSVTGGDALAWPEVYFSGAGWVSFAPTPDSGQTRPAVKDDNAIAEAGAGKKPKPKPTERPRDEQQSAGDDRRAEAAPEPPTASPAVIAVAATAAGLLPLLMLIGTRAARTARHRRRGPLGGWAELADTMLLLGLPVAGSQPATEAAHALDARTGQRPAARRVAADAEAVAFGPPGSRHGSPGGERSSWSDVVRVKRAARRTLPWWRRLLWPIDPRPLFRR